MLHTTCFTRQSLPVLYNGEFKMLIRYPGVVEKYPKLVPGR